MFISSNCVDQRHLEQMQLTQLFNARTNKQTWRLQARSVTFRKYKPHHTLIFDWTNPSLPTDVYMHEKTSPLLVLIMTCRRFGTKPVSELWLLFATWTPRNTLQWNVTQNETSIIQDNNSKPSAKWWPNYLDHNVLIWNTTNHISLRAIQPISGTCSIWENPNGFKLHMAKSKCHLSSQNTLA